MVPAQIDYQLAWRWLVPVPGVCRVTTHGLPDGAEELFPVELRDSAATAGKSPIGSVLVADLRGQAVGRLDTSGQDAVCVVLPGVAVSSLEKSLGPEWQCRLMYGLIPAGSPRLAIPLSSGRVAREGLQLHRPGRLLARLMVSALLLLARVGVLAPLKKQVLLIASRSCNDEPLGLWAGGQGEGASLWDDEYAVYFGVSGPDRKTVALRINKTSRELIKTGFGEAPCAALQAEHAALLAMARTTLSGNVPAVKEFVCVDASAALTQEYRRRRFIPRWRYRSAVANFLGQLAEVDSRTIGLSEWLERQVRDGLVGPLLDLSELLERKASSGVSIRMHREHGDFAPWNVSWDGRRLFVFDWERSVPEAPALFDAFYFVAAPALHVGDGFTPSMVLDRMRAFARRLCVIDDRLIDVHLAMWLLSRASLSGGDKACRLIDCYLQDAES